jgi:hypothetical protein
VCALRVSDCGCTCSHLIPNTQHRAELEMELLHLASLRRKVVEQKPQVFGDDERELPPATLTANAQHRMQWVSGMLTNLLGKVFILGLNANSWVDENVEFTCLVVLKYLPAVIAVLCSYPSSVSHVYSCGDWTAREVRLWGMALAHLSKHSTLTQNRRWDCPKHWTRVP